MEPTQLKGSLRRALCEAPCVGRTGQLGERGGRKAFAAAPRTVVREARCRSSSDEVPLFSPTWRSSAPNAADGVSTSSAAKRLMRYGLRCALRDDTRGDVPESEEPSERGLQVVEEEVSLHPPPKSEKALCRSMASLSLSTSTGSGVAATGICAYFVGVVILAVPLPSRACASARAPAHPCVGETPAARGGGAAACASE